mgnify:FL=1
MKTCKKCGDPKEQRQFHKKSDAADGLRSWCKGCRRADAKQRYPDKREHIDKLSRAWQASNPEKVNEYSRKSKRKLRLAALATLGDRCCSCGFSDIRALQIDHTNGGGTAERQKLGPLQIYKKIRDGQVAGYQLLCANCNAIKRIERNENGRKDREQI